MGVVKGATEGLGIQSMMKDMGYDMELEVNIDSSSAIGICSRSGLGKIRHMYVKELWVQQK